MKTLVAIALWAAALPTLAQKPTSFTYDVVAIKPNNTGSGSTSIDTNNNTYVAQNVRLTSLISLAYHLQIPAQLIGLPPWASGAHYDVNAKMDEDTAKQLKALKPEDRWNAELDMMQAVLADRFALKAHRESRELPEYALVQAKGGSKLKAGDASGKDAGSMGVHNTRMNATAVDLETLTQFLSNQVGRKVIDKTGLTGKFDLALEWSRDDATNSSSDGAGDKQPGIFTALQEQMGLKLESIKGPVDVIVIDHIEQPTEN